jgi:Ca-activated chloride channel family protein
VIHWVDPRFLNGLWALAPVAALLWFLLARRERQLRRLLDGEALARLAPERSPRRVRVKAALCFLACALAIVALARPQWGVHWQQVRRRGLELVFVLDTSNSMRATDLKPNRLQRAKWSLGDFLKKLSGDRIGLVAFAGSSFLECPLTLDHAAFSMMLDDMRPGIIPRGGTAIAQALETAVGSFDKGGGADRVIVLVTAGEDHGGGIERAIAALREKKVRVFAIGAGTTRGELIPAGGDAGAFLMDKSGKPVRTALREETLEKLAAATGGLYVRAADDDFGLDRVYSQGIASLRRDEKESRLVQAYEERFPWFLGAAVLLLTFESLLGDRRRGKERGAP